jgi:hypothetical protein
MIIRKFTHRGLVILFSFCVVCIISPSVQSATCAAETNLVFLVNTVGKAIRDAERAESASQTPRMNIVRVSISVVQQVKESDAGGLSLNIPVFPSLKAAAEFSRSEQTKIVQTLSFKVVNITVSGASLSSNLIEAISSSKKAMRHAVEASKYLRPERVKFSQAFEVLCTEENEVSIVFVGYKGAEVRGHSNSITFEIEVN